MFNFINFIIQQLMFFALHLSQSSFPRPLTAKDEQECFARMAEGDRLARDKLINHNLRLVAHIIKNSCYKRINRRDHIQRE